MRDILLFDQIVVQGSESGGKIPCSRLLIGESVNLDALPTDLTVPTIIYAESPVPDPSGAPSEPCLWGGREDATCRKMNIRFRHISRGGGAIVFSPTMLQTSRMNQNFKHPLEPGLEQIRGPRIRIIIIWYPSLPLFSSAPSSLTRDSTPASRLTE